jgi:tRNA nucleotidyltransferase/poly(A) polymerase
MLGWFKNRKKKAPTLPKDFASHVDSDAFKIVQTLKKGGFESYLVGGCVRDLLTGHSPKDFDIATYASPQKVKNLVSRSFIIGKRFRIVVAKRKLDHEDEPNPLFPPLVKGGKSNEKEIQITTFRRAPEMQGDRVNENVFGSPKDDAFRRDFTVNGLFLDPSNGKIVDFVGGMDDLAKKHLRIIGDPMERFKEDPIRILRALRFSARNSFEIEAGTLKALKQSTPLLAAAKKERVREEILKFLKEGTAQKGFRALYDYGIWKQISPKWHNLLETDAELREFFFRSCGKMPDWDPSFGSAPLFYMFLLPLTRIKGDRHSSDEILSAISDDMKISRIEKEEIQFIHQTLKGLATKRTPNFKLIQKDAQILRQIQFTLVLKALAEIDTKVWQDHWQTHLDAWKPHALWITSTLRKNPERGTHAPDGRRPSGEGRPSRSPRRRRRGPRRPDGAGPASGASSPPSVGE